MEKNFTSSIYSKLRNIRRSRGLTVNELAEKVGENHQKVGRIERGKSNLTIDCLLKLSKALDTPIDSIIQEENHQQGEDSSLLQEENHPILNEIVLFVEQHSEALSLIDQPEKKAKLISTVYSQAITMPKEHQKRFYTTLLNSLVLLNT